MTLNLVFGTRSGHSADNLFCNSALKTKPTNIYLKDAAFINTQKMSE